jgi:hypothetical protein
VNEYNKLKQYIKNLQEDTGTIYKIAIMLSKCDKTIDFSNKSETKSKPITNFKPTTELEEITDLDEDTNINDLVIKVKEKFPNEDIILFNAYGRSYHNEKTSSTLNPLSFNIALVNFPLSPINFGFPVNILSLATRPAPIIIVPSLASFNIDPIIIRCGDSSPSFTFKASIFHSFLIRYGFN